MKKMTSSILKKRKHKRKKLWSPAEEDFLLDLWAEKIDDLRGCRKKNHVHQEMANRMRKWGNVISAEEVSVKLHNLTNRYRKEKRQIESSTGTPCEWRPFQKVHAILGGPNGRKVQYLVEESYEEVSFASDYKFPVLLPSPVASPAIHPAPTISDVESSSETSGTIRKPVTKRKKEIIMDSILREYKKINTSIIEERNHVRKVDEEMLNIERERNEILKEFVTNAKFFQDNVTLMLKKIN